MQHIAFVTYAGAFPLLSDDALALAPLQNLGIKVDAVCWDDPGVDWRRFDAILIRSAWDYHLRLSEFLAWIDRLEGLPLWNPPSVVRWNAEKHYLLDLKRAGIPILPTVSLRRGATADLGQILQEQGWEHAVVKPAVSAGARQTWRTMGGPPDQARLQEMLEEGDVLVQCFADAIQAEGEWSLVFFGDLFSHAVLKKPKTDDFRVQENFGGCTLPANPPPALIEQAHQALQAAPGRVLYGRVDGVVEEGRLVLMELELIEPSLYLTQGGEPAAANFARAIAGLF